MKTATALFSLFGIWPFLCGAATFTEDFANGLGEWSWQWDDMGGGRQSSVSVTDTNGFNDSYSARFNLDGSSDVGMLWIERHFTIDPGVSDSVGLSFELYNPEYSDFNRWNVMTYIGESDPGEFADFTNIGETDTQMGWVNFQSNDPSYVSDSGDLWVAVGIWANWEAFRSIDIDHVQVTASVVPIPSTVMLMGSGILGLIGLTFVRKSNASV